MRHIRRLLVVLLALIVPSSQAQGNKFDPQALANTIVPVLDDQAIVVVHADLTRVEFGPLEQKLTALVDAMQMPPRQAAHAKGELVSGLRFPRQWRELAVKAGVRDVFVVFTMADFPRWPVYFVISTPPGGDARAVEALFQGAVTVHNQLVTETRDGKTIWGTSDLHERLKTRKQPAARPQLAEAFEAAGDATAQILLVPNPDARRVLIELTPDIPLPGGMIKGDTIGRGIAWAAVGFNMADLSAKLTIQSPDAAAATGLHDAATKLVGAAKAAVTQLVQEEPKVRDILGNLDALAAALTPRLAGDRLTLSLDADAGMKFTGLLAPAIAQSGARAQSVKSASHMLMILQACLMYANENKGQFPPDFDTLLKTQDITKAVFRNPTMPWKDVGYVYLRPVEGNAAPAEQVILYEAQELEKLKPTDGLNVGFGDGHVDFVPKEKFQKMLAESIDRNEQVANKRANEKKQ